MLILSILPGLLAVARLNPAGDIPQWGTDGAFFSITKTKDELTIVCPEEAVPKDVKVEKGWRCIKVEGPLDFALTGVLSSLAQPLAQAKISIFAISTFDTDYLLVKQENLKKALEILGKFCKILK